MKNLKCVFIFVEKKNLNLEGPVYADTAALHVYGHQMSQTRALSVYIQVSELLTDPSASQKERIKEIKQERLKVLSSSRLFCNVRHDLKSEWRKP